MGWWERTFGSARQDSGVGDPLLLRASLSGPSALSAAWLSETEQREGLARIRNNPMWTLDRGSGYYQQERFAKKKASLLGSGKDQGKSRVEYIGIGWARLVQHIWKRDSFTTAIHARFPVIIVAMFAIYATSFLVWAGIYWVTWQWDGTCFVGFNSFQSAVLFSIETAFTIGYGTHAMGDCWLPAVLVGAHCLVGLLMESVFLGIVFAKISHPKARSRTVLISETACIARRDGALKFMFRVADIRKRTAMNPRVRAVLYTWTPGRQTAEGEDAELSVQELPLHHLDPSLLVPVVVEHTVDERSPLFGHTHESLEAANAEVVVTFEGINDLGYTFTRRQSYLPSEIHWGHTFAPIIVRAVPPATQHSVNLARFHEVQPQPGFSVTSAPARLSRAVVAGAPRLRALPPCRLLENTLCLADDMVVCPRGGRWYLMVRLGDRYPSQMAAVDVRMFLYRYAPRHTPEGEVLPFSVDELPLDQPQVMLRYPCTVRHELREGSPVAGWTTPDGIMQDRDAEVVVMVRAVTYASNALTMRTKLYQVVGGIKWGHGYQPCVQPPTLSHDGRTHVAWAEFHATQPLHPQAQAPPARARPTVTLQGRAAPDAGAGGGGGGPSNGGVTLSPGQFVGSMGGSVGGGGGFLGTRAQPWGEGPIQGGPVAGTPRDLGMRLGSPQGNPQQQQQQEGDRRVSDGQQRRRARFGELSAALEGDEDGSGGGHAVPGDGYAAGEDGAV